VTSLRALTGRLLDPAASIDRLTATVTELGALCVDLTRLGRGDDAADQAESALPSGRALSPSDAARCLADPLRTARFLRGIDAAIRARRRRLPDRPVEIVYAGTGPFAPLIVPLLPLYARSEVSVTLIDVHERSVELVGRLVDRLGLADRVCALVAADATTYVHPAERPPGIVIVEAMQRSLSAEPQVAIARQLAPQLDAAGVLIPERVTVRLAWTERSALFRHPGAGGLGDWAASAVTVLELTKEMATVALDWEDRSAATVVTCPNGAESGHVPVLFTTIDVYGGHTLGPFESGLTYPEPLWPLADPRVGERVAVWYQLGARPGLFWERLGLEPAPGQVGGRG
jgi:hypothetical protein